MTKKIISYLNDFLKEAEQAFTYQKVFDSLGISSFLKEKYIDVAILDKKYINLIYNSVKKFIKQPLFKDLDLKDENDLKFLKDNDFFKTHQQEVIESIQKKLKPYEKKVLNYLKIYPSKEEISLEEISKAVKLDKTSLLFVLDNLKENDEIYDYNGREVTLK